MSKIEAPTAEDRELAVRVAAWMKTLADKPDASDYEHNLGVYGQIERVHAKGLGLVASAVASFRREQTRRVETQRAQTASKHVGVVGARQDFHVRLVGRWETEGSYGVTHIHKFEVVDGPDAGARLTWFGSSALRIEARTLEPGDTCWVRTTIKKHVEYKGVKETQISRATLIPDPETAKTNKTVIARAKREATAARKTFGEPKVVALWVTTGCHNREIEVGRVVQYATSEFRLESRKTAGGQYVDGWVSSKQDDETRFGTAEEAIEATTRRYVCSGGIIRRKF